jgi:hypothetical protein
MTKKYLLENKIDIEKNIILISMNKRLKIFKINLKLIEIKMI